MYRLVFNNHVQLQQKLQTSLCLFLCSRLEGVCWWRRQSSLRHNCWRQRQVSLWQLMCSTYTPAPYSVFSVQAPLYCLHEGKKEWISILVRVLSSVCVCAANGHVLWGQIGIQCIPKVSKLSHFHPWCEQVLPGCEYDVVIFVSHCCHHGCLKLWMSQGFRPILPFINVEICISTSYFFFLLAILLFHFFLLFP